MARPHGVKICQDYRIGLPFLTMNTLNDSPKVKKTTPKRWERSKVVGIRRDTRSGLFCINKKVHGRPVNESLTTTDFAVAKTRFYARIAFLESEAPKPAADPLTKSGKLTFADLTAIYLQRAAAGAYRDLKKSTLERYDYQFRSVRTSWALVPAFVSNGTSDFDTLRPAQVSYDDLLAWRQFFLALPADHEDHDEEDAAGLGYAGGYFNKVLQGLRAVFEIAIERGQTTSNPAKRLKLAPVRPGKYRLPTAAQFAKILSTISLTDDYVNTKAQNYQPRKLHARDFIEGLSWTGLRLSEANALCRDFVDLKNWTINLPASVVKGKLGDERGRTIPILPEARPLIQRLYENATPEGNLFQVLEAPDTLRSACKAAGWTEHFSHHSLRHYFATRCLEATGGDVLTVAGWLGHRDQGKLLLSTYAHLCEKHSQETAEKIRFNQPENVVELKTACG